MLVIWEQAYWLSHMFLHRACEQGVSSRVVYRHHWSDCEKWHPYQCWPDSRVRVKSSRRHYCLPENSRSDAFKTDLRYQFRNYQTCIICLHNVWFGDVQRSGPAFTSGSPLSFWSNRTRRIHHNCTARTRSFKRRIQRPHAQIKRVHIREFVS